MTSHRAALSGANRCAGRLKDGVDSEVMPAVGGGRNKADADGVLHQNRAGVARVPAAQPMHCAHGANRIMRGFTPDLLGATRIAVTGVVGVVSVQMR
jgi:hypothetical protein